MGKQLQDVDSGKGRLKSILSNSWFWLAAFVVVWCALRVFWLTCDAGILSVWEYGYNVTDEGYYMGAAKDKYLWGAFCDFARNESFTYGYSSGTHWLALIGYWVFGLTNWGFRVPFYVLYLAAWICAFLYVAKRRGGAYAFAVCAAVSSVPMVVVYERTAGNDLVIASLGLVAFFLAAGRGVWRIPVSAAVIGFATLVKPSVWIMLPIVASAVLSERKTRAYWMDLAVFAACAVASVFAWKLLALASVLPEASLHGMSASEIIRRTTTHNPLPSLFDFNQLFRGFSSFPRDPSFKLLGPLATFISAVPLAMAARAAILRRVDWRTILYVSIPVYVAGISVNNTIYTHYLHPVIVLVPILFATIVDDIEEDSGRTSPGVRFSLSALGILLAALAVILFVSGSSYVRPQEAADMYSRISNLPKRIVWVGTAGWILVSSAVVTAVLAFMRGFSETLRNGALWFVVAFAGSSVAFAGMPAVHLAPYMHEQTVGYLAPVCVALVVSAIFQFFVFGLNGTPARSRAIAYFLPATVLLSFLVLPSWLGGTREMLRPGTHCYAVAADDIARLVPTNAVVIGERSSAVLMGKSIRTATTMPGCNPMPIVEKLLGRDPKKPLFALADSQNAYNLQHFQKHRDKFRLDLVRQFKMPSFGTGKPADVYLCRIMPVKGAQK